MNAIRELFVELGVKIDNSKFKQFSDLINKAKQNLNGLHQQLNTKKVGTQNLNTGINKPNLDFLNYAKELKALDIVKRKELMKFNSSEENKKLIDQIKVITAEERIAIKAQKEKIKLAKQEKSIVSANWATFRKFIMGYAYIRAGFNVVQSIKSTLIDIQRFRRIEKGRSNSIYSKEEIQNAITFSATIKQIFQTLSNIKNKVVTGLFGSMSSVLMVFNKFLIVNRKFITLNIKGMLDIVIVSIKLIIAGLIKLKETLDPVVRLFGGWKTVIKGIVFLTVGSWMQKIIMLFIKYGKTLLAVSSATFIFRNTLSLLSVAWASLVSVFTIVSTHPVLATIVAISTAVTYLVSQTNLLDDVWSKMKLTIDSLTQSLKTYWSSLTKFTNGLFNNDMVQTHVNNRINELVEFNKNKLKNTAENMIYKFQGLSPAEKFINKANTNNYAPVNNFSIKIENKTTEPLDMSITNTIRTEVQKVIEYENEKFLFAIGAKR
jgi:hypothetical protein